MSFRKRSTNSPLDGNYASKSLKIVCKSVYKGKSGQDDGKYMISLAELAAFFKLIEDDDHIYDFLAYDMCCKLADKYLLAMVFTYFIRAGLKRREFNRTNFFIALYLAHDIEEDEEDHKSEILFWALGSNWRQYAHRFMFLRDHLWKKMNYRGIVSCKLCNEVMALFPEHHLWERHRSVHHAGAMRPHSKIIQKDISALDSFDSPPVCRLCLPSDASAEGKQDLTNADTFKFGSQEE